MAYLHKLFCLVMQKFPTLQSWQSWCLYQTHCKWWNAAYARRFKGHILL